MNAEPPWWECECLHQMQADPAGHSDRGGHVVVDGPTCPECGQRMTLSPDQEE